MQKQHVLTIVIILSFGTIGTVDAALVGRLPATPGGTDFQAYYDNIGNLTWLADANYAKSSGYNANASGMMTWSNANSWASWLNINGISGWRLPDTALPDASCSLQNGNLSYGYNCTGSEMGNLFYNVLNGSAGTQISASHNSNFNLFSNIQSNYYWSMTGGYNPATYGNVGFAFSMDGDQNAFEGITNNYAWAVWSGDVSATPSTISPDIVPLPASLWLFSSGLIGLIAIARGKRY